MILTLIFSQVSFCQENNPITWELGVKGISSTLPYHLNYSPDNAPQLEFLNGLFFRVSKKRTALRCFFNYSHKQLGMFSYELPASGTGGGIGHQKSIQFAGGIQGQLSQKKDFMYSFFDLYYRHVGTNGILFGDMEDPKCTFIQSSHQVGANIGLGFRIKVVHRITLSSEIFLDLYRASTDLSVYSNTPNPQLPSTSPSSSCRPGARIFLAVRL